MIWLKVFWYIVHFFRWIILAIVIGTITYFLLRDTFLEAKVFDIELPSAEREHLNESTRKQENKEAWERVQDGEVKNERDYEKAWEHFNENYA